MRFLKEQIDRWAIRAAAKSLPRIPPRPDQAPEVAALLARADLFNPPETAGEVSLSANLDFEFSSSVATPFPKNNTVYGRIFPVQGDWTTAPSVILLHGWNAEMHYANVMPQVARELNKRGMNGVLLQLPYHLQRRPVQGERISNFISEDIPRMLEATAQAIADLNALILWLKTKGSPAVASWGFSLGGWLVGLHLCASSSQDAAVLTTPVSNLERAVSELEFCHPIRSALKVAPADLNRLNLQSRRPRIPPASIHLVEARYDRFVSAETYPSLAQAWGLPGWEKVAQSHITILFSRKDTAPTIRWLQARLRR